MGMIAIGITILPTICLCNVVDGGAGDVLVLF